MGTTTTVRIHRGYKTELQLNKAQQTLCRKHAGCARFAYNWGLQRKLAAYATTGKTPTAIDLHRELNTSRMSWLGKFQTTECKG